MSARGVGLLFACAVAVPMLAGVAQSDKTGSIVAEVIRTGSVIVRGVTFERARPVLTSAAGRSLEELRVALTQHTEWTFEVQGHTTEAGSPEANLALSRERAEAVVAWLVDHGIPSSRLVAHGYGEAKPLHDAVGAEEALRRNRIELRKLNEE